MRLFVIERPNGELVACTGYDENGNKTDDSDKVVKFVTVGTGREFTKNDIVSFTYQIKT